MKRNMYNQGMSVVEVILGPGAAVDGTGREIVVPEPVRLSEPRFYEVNGVSPDPQAFYPVLLQGVDQPGASPALGNRSCGPMRDAMLEGMGYLASANEQVACLVMIETAEGLRNVRRLL